MSKKRDGLIELIAGYLRMVYKSYEIEGVCVNYGIEANPALNPHDSKALYVKSGLVKLSNEELTEIAIKLSEDFEDWKFNKDLEQYLGDKMFRITFITRKNIVEYLNSKSNIEGKMKWDEFLRPLWNVDAYLDNGLLGYTGRTFGEDMIYHLKVAKDTTYKDVLLEQMSIKYISDSSFKAFLERLVDPEVRDGEEQAEFVHAINDIIKNDKMELRIFEKISGVVRYKVYEKIIINGNMKNLIFAPLGTKPDIVIDDTISNDLKIIGDVDNCLLYNFEHGADGLKWLTLVQWWKQYSTDENIEKNLYERLYKSLDSDIERLFFKEYYKLYRNEKKKDIPALIPQVFLHYDPYSKAMRKNNIVFTHQRMDFLMLIPGGMRIVIELDGKQHYSVDNQASPKMYAEMVKDTRELQLKGYEVFRFGGYEFQADQQPMQMIEIFFEKLFKMCGIEF